MHHWASVVFLALLISKEVYSWSVPKNGNFSPPLLGLTPFLDGSRLNQVDIPILIAHRGDKILIPEHTIAAYDVALMSNIDYVEPDLVMTSDKVFVCFHDLILRAGTDVSERKEFASKMVEKVTLELDGKNVTIENDWFISDFTFEELSTLRVYQRKSDVRPQYFNGLYKIPSFQEYIDVVHKDTWRRRNATTGEISDRVTGMIPELKHPNYHNKVVFETEHLMETMFLDELRKNGYHPEKVTKSTCDYKGVAIPCSQMVVQCFDVETIKYLREVTDLSLLTLMDTSNMEYLTYKGMESLANVTQYVGLWKELLYTGTEQQLIYEKMEWNETAIGELGGFIEPENLVNYVHSLGIKMGIYTLYQSMEKSQRGCASGVCDEGVTKELELNYYFDLGVDAFFVEGVTDSMRIRERYFKRNEKNQSRGGDDGLAGTGGVINTTAGGNALVLLLGTLLVISWSS